MTKIELVKEEVDTLLKLTNWLNHMKDTYQFLEHDPVIKAHVKFLRDSGELCKRLADGLG